jgi:hypothetical protein
MQAGPITRAERLAFLALSTAVFLLVALRAWLVPVVHDEAMTFFVYVETGEFIPFHAHWDAGNHVLCTALGRLSYQVFGMHAWALRLPSVIAFLLYAWAVFHWGALLSRRLVRSILWAALLLCPFLLDFFSLFRGYGISMALLATSLLALAHHLRSGRTGALWVALITLSLSVWANLTLITIEALALCVVLFAGLRTRTWRWLVPWCAMGVGPFVVAAVYSLRLSAGGGLYSGLDTGILDGTIASFMPFILGVEGPFVSVMVAVVVSIFLGLACVLSWTGDRGTRAVALMLVGGLLLTDVVGRIILFQVHGTLFPEGRMALQWLVLSILLIALVADVLAEERPAAAWCVLPLLFLPLRTLWTANVDSTMNWPEQAIPRRIQDHVVKLATGHPMTLGIYHQMPAAWAFALREHGIAPLLAQTEGHPDQGTELLMIDPLREAPPPGYRMIDRAVTGRLDLYQQESTSWRTVLDTVLPEHRTDAEFIELLHPDIGPLRGVDLRIDAEVVLGSPVDPLTLDLVCELNGADGSRRYDLTLVQFARGGWHGDTLHTIRCIPRVPIDAERLVLYLWNKHRHPLTVMARTRLIRAAAGDR